MHHSKEKNTVIVQLYNFTLSEESDKRFGKVVSRRRLNVGDLIDIVTSRRTDLHAETLRAAFDLLNEVAIEEIANGSLVDFGPGRFSLTVRGVFTGDHAPWDPAVNSLHLKVTPGRKLRAAIDNIKADIRGMAGAGAIVNTLTDVVSGEINTRLTPGGGAILSGNKIKIAGNNPANGIRFINQDTGEAYTIPKKSLLTNNPKEVSLILPPDLPSGNYKLELTTQYTSTSVKLLKEPRTYLLNCTLEAD